jgi:hypothetical protein
MQIQLFGAKDMTVHISDVIGTPFFGKSNLEELNKYHNSPDKEAKYQAVRKACENLMAVILDNCPSCRDQTEAIHATRLVRMWANSAIALDEIDGK